MIQHPAAIIAVLLTIEIVVLYLANHPHYSKIFNFLPSVFWIYFLPMLASSLGLIDPNAEIYTKLTTWLLPGALFLLLMTVDIKSIFRLGPMALLAFFIGSLGIMLGIVIVFVLFKGNIGAEFWSGFAALGASWTGGSANMIAAKEALAVPDQIFFPMVIVDTIVPYVWMAFMIAGVGLVPWFDRINGSNRRCLDDLSERIKCLESITTHPLTAKKIVCFVILAFVGGTLSIGISHLLPEIPKVVSSSAWAIIAATCLGIALSFTPVRKLQSHGSNKVGYFVLYFVLTSIGARAALTHISSAFVLIGAGFLVVLIHAAILLLACRFLRLPLFLAVVASQANVGGVASAPLVAEIYQKGFASVGLLLAVLGNIEGTYLGIIIGQICRFLSGV